MGLLDVRQLNVKYPDSQYAAVADLSFSIKPGESIGIVGESGSGKTQTALAIMGLLPANATTSGEIEFDGTELLRANAATLNQLRARRLAMVFQDPLASLNPYVRIGDQLRRILLEHQIASRSEAKKQVLDMLDKVGLPDANRQFSAFPHQLSGGMRQRVMLGAALLGKPDLLIADEPTTALDVTVQAQVLEVLRALRAETEAALLLITHDLGVVAAHCARTLVMDQGRLLEDGSTKQVFSTPASEKMKALLDVAPRIDQQSAASATSLSGEVVFELDNIAVKFRERRAIGKRYLNAVRPMSVSLHKGETLAIVGESGSGKTSLARASLGLLPTASGQVSLLGQVLPDSVTARSQANRRQLQMVFQDPLASLNPSMRVADIVVEPLQVQFPGRNTRKEHTRQVTKMLERVGLDAEFSRRLPHELSGGQAQRVAIARALILNPQVLICDEAVAALDGTVQEEILTLLREEQRNTGLAIIFITHDLAVVRRISHRVAVMYMGRLFEVAECSALFSRPRHPYTKALLNAVLVPDPAVQASPASLVGEIGSMLQPQKGCTFQPRCEQAVAKCAGTVPTLSDIGGGLVACHRADELDLSY